MVTGEISSDGSTIVTDPDRFKFAICAMMYRI